MYWIILFIELTIFVICCFNIIYFLIFSLSAKLPRSKKWYNKLEQTGLTSQNQENRLESKIAIIIPAYKEDSVILESVQSCLNQDYPAKRYDIIVASDKMEESTVKTLKELPIIVVEIKQEESTKTKAIKQCISSIKQTYDLLLILDADNIIEPTFLKEIIIPFKNPTVKVVQAHRTAKNLNNNMAYLDACSEEINNTIFRLGQVNLGLSASLIGSGMAFRYNYYETQFANQHAIGGFDRMIEFFIARSGEKIHYLPNTYVLDEKVQSYKNFSTQRTRWVSAQYHYLREFLPDLKDALKKRNIDFINKVIQHLLLPRMLLLGGVFFLTFLALLFCPSIALRWSILSCLLTFAMLIAIPPRLYTRQLGKAILVLPYTFLLMVSVLFKIRKGNKRFIHTPHGINKK